MTAAFRSETGAGTEQIIITMNQLVIGSKFRVCWEGHETCYEGRIYKVKSVLRNCTCASYQDSLNGHEDRKRRPHLHVVATIVESLRPADCDGHDNWFSGIDPETLIDVSDPSFRLEIVDNAGCQMELF